MQVSEWHIFDATVATDFLLDFNPSRHFFPMVAIDLSFLQNLPPLNLEIPLQQSDHGFVSLHVSFLFYHWFSWTSRNPV